MPDIDAAAQAQIDSGAFAPADLILIDFLGDPLRATTCGKDLSFAGTGDPDLDGHTFVGFDGSVVDVGDVSDGTDGSETLEITVSGVQEIPDSLMADINDKSKWKGRVVRVWRLIFDPDGNDQQGATIELFTGYATKVRIRPGAETSSIVLSAEKYLASSSQASNRTWLVQAMFDPADQSAQATLAAANMGRGSNAGAAGGGSAASGSGGGGGYASARVFN